MVAGASLWIATAANLALWQELGRLALFQSGSGWLLVIGLGGITLASTALLLTAFAWRWTLKPVISLLLLAAATGAHYMLTYGVVIDSTMITNVLQTDVREAADVLSLRMLYTVGLLGFLPIALVWWVPLRWPRAPRLVVQQLMFTVGLVLLLVAAFVLSFQPLASTMRNHKQVRYLINPLNSVYAVGYLATSPLRRKPGVLLPLGEDAQLGTRYTSQTVPPLLVLVLGETARSANFGLNGYARDTTPVLKGEDVTSFLNAWSCGTSTAASVPCMFSHLGRKDFDSRPANYETVLDVLQRAGLAVLWVDNQSGCKGVCDRVPSVSTSELKDPALCSGGECLDPIMLNGLSERIAALPAERRARGVVVVMHQMGSHGPAYYKRSPPALKRFLPECTSNNLQDCSQQALVNAYDNTIATTDAFLGATIQWLKTQEGRYAPAMVYVSDHGESLGENNLYLHGLPYSIAPDVQKHVPWVSWFSATYTQRTGVGSPCLKGLRDREVTHDNYFHSVLGLMDVRTAVYQPTLDAYAACATPRKP